MTDRTVIVLQSLLSAPLPQKAGRARLHGRDVAADLVSDRCEPRPRDYSAPPRKPDPQGGLFPDPQQPLF